MCVLFLSKMKINLGQRLAHVQILEKYLMEITKISLFDTFYPYLSH